MFVYFDAVGTLLYPQPPADEVYWQFGQAHGSNLSHQQIAQRFRENYAQAFGAAGNFRSDLRSCEAAERERWQRLVANVFHELPDSAALFDALWNYFGQSSSWRLYPDVWPTLRRLEQNEIGLGIASNFDSRLERIVEELPELKSIRVVVTSARAGWRKPASQFFQQAAAACQREPTELWMVGDDFELDYRAARAAGWRARWLDRQGAEPGNELRPIRSLRELPDRLESGDDSPLNGA